MRLATTGALASVVLFCDHIRAIAFQFATLAGLMLPPLTPADENLLLNYRGPRGAGGLAAILRQKPCRLCWPMPSSTASCRSCCASCRSVATPICLQDAGLQETLSELRQKSTLVTGQSMLLQYHGDRIMKALAADGVPARIVKGPVFARKLYRHVADRPFTDIDILVEPAHLADANRVIAACGFELCSDEAQSHDLQEFKWLEKENSSLLIELHGNLVHDSGMRRRLSLGFRELRTIDGDATDTPAALLTIAIVHAAGGHKFHRLQLCVDVLQGVRALQSADAEARLLEAARMTGIELELATVLNVTGRLFDERRALESPAGSSLISASGLPGG